MSILYEKLLMAGSEFIIYSTSDCYRRVKHRSWCHWFALIRHCLATKSHNCFNCLKLFLRLPDAPAEQKVELLKSAVFIKQSRRNKVIQATAAAAITSTSYLQIIKEKHSFLTEWWTKLRFGYLSQIRWDQWKRYTSS